MRASERTPLTRRTDSPDNLEFASLLRRRRTRIRQFQCCVCATFIAIFTMAMVMTISYSVTHADEESETSASNVTIPPTEASSSLNLKMAFAPGSGSYTNPESVSTFDRSATVFVTGGLSKKLSNLTDAELKEGLRAGQQAIQDRLSADTAALASPLPTPSPESRHRYAVSTSASVGTLALAALAEIAATKKIESSRAILSEGSAIGSFFDGGWQPRGACKEFLDTNCTVGKYRTFDGSCNRPKQWGSSFTPFRRALPPAYADGIEEPRRAVSGKELPSAREVSLKVHRPSPSSNPSFTVMLAVFGQFLDHDITATAISQGVNGSSISCCPPSVGHPECYPVHVGAGDPVYDVAQRDCMEFVRSAPAPQCKLGPRQQLNQVSAFIDGSAIYGSDLQTAEDLRAFAAGRLKMQTTPDNRTLLPASTNLNDGCNRATEELRGRYCFAAGDARANENLHLTTMHLLWARQHNRIADELAEMNPGWDDETLYEEARRIVGAQLQHVAYNEFVPIVLGESVTSAHGLKPLKSGYRELIDDPNDTGNDPTIANHFAAAAFRFAHTLLPGLMKVTDAQEGTSSYVELHRMLFNPYSLYARGGVESSVTSAAGNFIQKTSTHVTSQLTSHLFEDPIGNATVPCGLDLVSLNIQRGRDHGLPGYTRWREFCGLGKVASFTELDGHLDAQALEQISTLYESVDDVDLYTGALAELPTPGGIVGPTFSCMIADQFVRLQKGDRYWYEAPGQPHSFTPDQLQEVRKTSLAKLICDCSDGVTQIQPEIMRSVGPDNPMISCEDIEGPSLEPWTGDPASRAVLKAIGPVPDWLSFKTIINDTIRDVTTFINGTISSMSPATADWLAFRSYVNGSFSDLRNQLAGLHPKAVVETSAARETAPYIPDSYILRLPTNSSMYEGWVTFRMQLVKSLNDTIASMGGALPTGSEWLLFKSKIKDQFADLKSQIASMKTDLAPILSQKGPASGGSATKVTSKDKELVSPPVAFDWVNFKSGILNSLDDAVMNIADKMPAPSDPAWAMFGDEIKSRYAAIRDKITAAKTPTELKPVPVDPATDWLSFKSEIIQTVNTAVQNIEDNMPAPGDPGWLTYRDKIMKVFTKFNSKFAPPAAAPLSSSGPSLYTPANASYVRATSDTASAATKGTGAFGPNFTGKQLSDFINDWISFRSKINDSLTTVIGDIIAKKPSPADVVGWIAFENSLTNEFANLKNEVNGIKSEWIAADSSAKLNSNQPDNLKLRAAGIGKFAGAINPFAIYKPPLIIPDADWASFKNEINDTVMNFLTTINRTDKIDWLATRELFTSSIAELKNDIVSLRNLISNSSFAPSVNYSKDAWDALGSDWVQFHAQLNATVNNLVENLKNETKKSTIGLMKILLDAEDEIANLDPPGVLPTNWTPYFVGMNKTLIESLGMLGGTKGPSAQLKISEPPTSLATNLKLQDTRGLLISTCTLTVMTMFIL